MRGPRTIFVFLQKLMETFIRIMGMARLKRIFLLGMTAATLGLVYFLVNTGLDLNITFPLLKSSSIDTVQRLKSRLTGEGLEGRLKGECVIDLLILSVCVYNWSQRFVCVCLQLV